MRGCGAPGQAAVRAVADGAGLFLPAMAFFVLKVEEETAGAADTDAGGMLRESEAEQGA